MVQISEFNSFLRNSNLESSAFAMRRGQKSVLYVDYCRVRDKYDFLQEMALGLAPNHLFVIDGANSPSVTNSENMTLIKPPKEVYYNSHLKLPTASKWDGAAFPEDFDDMVALFKMHAAEVNEYVDSNIIRNCIKTAFMFSLTTMRMLRPELVMIWNAFHPLSQAAIKAAKLSDIPVCYAEFGVLPGGMNVDFLGQMGESAVARKSKKFDAMPVDKADIENARLALDAFFDSGSNRRSQIAYGKDNLGERIRNMADGRPVVLYAAHNDLASGMYPYTKNSRDFHSPVFSSSEEGASAMFELARENGWFLLYKPHPFFTKNSLSEDPSHVLHLGDANINECVDIADVTCTILSQVSYVARIRRKPVVMLGYNQMQAKGVVYEAYKQDAIVPAICNALAHGVTIKQEKAWLEHTARLLRYYLYRWSDQQKSDVKWQEPITLAQRLTAMIAENKFQDFGTQAALMPDSTKSKPSTARKRPSSTNKI